MTCAVCPAPTSTLSHELANLLCTNHILGVLRARNLRATAVVWPKCIKCDGPLFLPHNAVKNEERTVCARCALGLDRTVDVTTQVLPVIITRGPREHAEPRACEAAETGSCPPKQSQAFLRPDGRVACDHHYKEIPF